MQPRFYQATISIKKDLIIISDQQIVYQLAKIFRLKKNDLFVVFTPQAEYQLILKELGDKTAAATIIAATQTNREPAKKLILYQSLLKKDKFEWILQKGVELGIHTFIPVVSNNAIVREITPNKLKRYQKIITESTEQCGGQHLAELKNPLTFEQALTRANKQPGQKIIAWEGQANNQLSKQIDKKSDEYQLFIGPEGGFSAQEIELAIHSNLTIISLGSRILRAETAAIAAASFILLSSIKKNVKINHINS